MFSNSSHSYVLILIDRYGTPLYAKDYKDLNETEAIHKITEDLEILLKACTINADTWEELMLLDTGLLL